MVVVRDSLNNVFGFTGLLGNKPGAHSKEGFIKPFLLGNYSNILNYISDVKSNYNEQISFCYGCLEFSLETDLLLSRVCADSPSFGVSLDSWNSLGDATETTFSIPLLPELFISYTSGSSFCCLSPEQDSTDILTLLPVVNKINQETNSLEVSIFNLETYFIENISVLDNKRLMVLCVFNYNKEDF